MATDECLGAQAHGRHPAQIQNGDWRGLSPQPTENIAASADSTHGSPHHQARTMGRVRSSLLTETAKW